MSRYEEFRISDRYIYSAEQFYTAMASEGSGGGVPTVDITISDFMADVELTAKRVLYESPAHWILFYEMYVKGNDQFVINMKKSMMSDAFLDIKHAMQEVVGAAFKFSRIHPVKDYFNEKGLR
jgi:hypothetical protein